MTSDPEPAADAAPAADAEPAADAVERHGRFEAVAPDAPGLDPDLVERVHAWVAADPDEASRAELADLLAVAGRGGEAGLRAAARAQAAAAELADRFAGTLAFGTAGLRGAMAAGPNRMNRAVVIRAAAGLGEYLRGALVGAGAPDAPVVVVGYDARYHSHEFALDTAAVLTAQGADVRLLPSALPTPVLAFAVRHLDADAGVMVTASHNPPADNGYKVYLGGRVVTDSGQGSQIVPPYDALIAERIDAAPAAADVPRAADGWTVLGDDVLRAYLDAVHRLSDGGERRDLRIVTTPLHGVGGEALRTVLTEAGFQEVVTVHEQAEPDPDFPTVAFPNPEEPGAIDLALAVAQDWGADVVLANDPDADRCAVATWRPAAGTYRDKETARSQGWHVLTGDEVGALLGQDAAGRAARLRIAPGTLALASSVVSSRVLGRIATHHGLRHVTTLTGFKWISRVDGLVFGYEEALGYCVDPATVRDKDGISAALRVAELAQALKAEGRTLDDALDDIARAYGLYATAQVSARFDDLSRIGETMARLRSAPPATLGGAAVTGTFDLADGWDGLPPTEGLGFLAADSTRVIVRPSGTEPKVKAYLEVVVPVDEDASTAQVDARRAVARDRLTHVGADVRAALGID